MWHRPIFIDMTELLPDSTTNPLSAYPYPCSKYIPRVVLLMVLCWIQQMEELFQAKMAVIAEKDEMIVHLKSENNSLQVNVREGQGGGGREGWMVEGMEGQVG